MEKCFHIERRNKIATAFKQLLLRVHETTRTNDNNVIRPIHLPTLDSNVGLHLQLLAPAVHRHRINGHAYHSSHLHSTLRSSFPLRAKCHAKRKPADPRTTCTVVSLVFIFSSRPCLPRPLRTSCTYCFKPHLTQSKIPVPMATDLHRRICHRA